MYKKTEEQLTLDQFIFPFGKLDKENRWVQLSNSIPWREAEEIYSKKFVNNGNRAKSIRIALGSLIIKQILNCSDEETVNQVKENPYLQFFVGMKEYSFSCPFSSQSMVEFRKRFSEDDILRTINDIVLKESLDIEEKANKSSKEEGCFNESEEVFAKANSGSLAIDATCAPADISYPQDLKLLNITREKTEKMIDEIHNSKNGKKPRTYRERAKKDFLKLSKAKRKIGNTLRKGLKKQLNYIERNFKSIEDMVKKYKVDLCEKSKETLEILRKVFIQQKEMIEKRIHSVSDRIVNIAQPHLRPIPKGKAKAKTEFGAKVEISIINGFARIETLDFNAYNEGKNLISIVKRYKERNGFYPERVLVDKLYRNRENLKFCKENNIKITGPALGRPKKDLIVNKKEEYQDICDRNCVEGKFGEGKTAYGLDRISARLKNTSICVINMIFLVMNLKKRVRLSFLKNLILKYLEIPVKKIATQQIFKLVG